MCIKKLNKEEVKKKIVSLSKGFTYLDKLIIQAAFDLYKLEPDENVDTLDCFIELSQEKKFTCTAVFHCPNKKIKTPATIGEEEKIIKTMTVTFPDAFNLENFKASFQQNLSCEHCKENHVFSFENTYFYFARSW